jgi:AraC family transcriptional regulator
MRVSNPDQIDTAARRYKELMPAKESMTGPVGKALWFVEAHFARDITLDEIASVGGVSRYHMTRAFGAATGHSIMRYVRGRRLTEAARVLANGAPDILTVAIDAGYGSHEAFTRAFREEFGVTPESIRAQRHLHNIRLVEPITMDETVIATVESPRLENREPLLIAGLGERYSCETSAAIPAQWQRFLPHLGNVPGQIGRVAYGVNCNGDDLGNFDYICGAEVTDFARLPAGWSTVRIAAHRYAVFSHRSHISAIRRTWSTIWNKWLPEAGFEADDAPLFERYDEKFDSATGDGGLEIWVPIRT